MKEKTKNILKHPLTLTIYGAVATVIIDSILKPLLNFYLIKFLWSLLFITLPIWSFLIFSILVILILFFLKSKILSPKFTPYTSSYEADKFDDIIWAWHKAFGKSEIRNLEAQCPECRTPLQFGTTKDNKFALFCTTCDEIIRVYQNELEYEQYVSNLSNKIIGIYNSSEWKKRITKRYQKKNGLVK